MSAERVASSPEEMKRQLDTALTVLEEQAPKYVRKVLVGVLMDWWNAYEALYAEVDAYRRRLAFVTGEDEMEWDTRESEAGRG